MAPGFSSIPVVSLDPWRSGRAAARGGLADEVRAHCHEVGFFVLVDHGIEAAFVDEVFTMMHRLFALPESDKLLIDKRRSPHFRGWEATGSEYTNNRPDIREQVDLWSEWPVRTADALDPHLDPNGAAYLHLLGPNQWFPEPVLPGYRQLLTTWFDRMGELARQLMAVLCTGLGLEPGVLDQRFGHQQMSLTKLIRYPPTPPGQAGVNGHHDAGFLTILAPGPTPGLQVENPDGVWVDVEAPPGAFVINLGEMLQAMTGNYYVATPHRVITAAERYSAAYFHGPALDTTLDPLPLPEHITAAVAASPRHATAGFMARKAETEAGVGDMASSHKPSTYGEQLWNYFSRSYPDMVAAHYPDLVDGAKLDR